MIYVALVLAAGYPVLLVAFLKHLKDRDLAERRERDTTETKHEAERAETAERHADALTALLDRVDAAHAARADEIASLLQRIQAPEAAVIQHAGERAGPTETILPLSDKEAAERAAAIARIEQLERDGFSVPEVIG